MSYDAEINEGRKMKKNLSAVKRFFRVTNAPSLLWQLHPWKLTAKGEKGHPGLQGSIYPNHYSKSLKKVSPKLPILITNKILLTGTNNMDHAKEVNAFLS